MALTGIQRLNSLGPMLDQPFDDAATKIVVSDYKLVLTSEAALEQVLARRWLDCANPARNPGLSPERERRPMGWMFRAFKT